MAEPLKAEDTLKKRYLYKLFTRLIGLVIGFVNQAIIPRGLGPAAYGNFNFLSNFFTQFVNFFDAGTSLGFYTKLSQRPRESALVYFYFCFSGVISLMVAGFVVIAQSLSLYMRIWPEQDLFYIYLAAFLGIFTWVTETFNKMADAYGVTVYAEKARIFQGIFAAAIIVSLFVSGRLNLANFFYYNYLNLFFLAVAFIWIMERGGYLKIKDRRLSIAKTKGYLKEFYNYSHPLFAYALAGLIIGIFDRWLLQLYGGSVQQGFYGLSYQIGGTCFLFTSAMTPLITREFSVAHNKEDLVQMARLFRRYIPLFYSITAYFCCFIAVEADKVIYIFGGNAYRDAIIAVTIMAFYPVHQTYGQLSGAVFYATGQTGLYRNIGIVFMLLGLPVTYFLIAPHGKFGLNLGATGLAVKMVLFQFVVVNVQLFFNARLLRFSFWKYFSHQIGIICCFLSIAVISALGADKILGVNGGVIQSFICAGALYTLIAIILAYMAPISFGFNKRDVRYMVQTFFHRKACHG